MKITIQNGKITIFSDEKEIESFTFEQEITFKGLMNYLLGLNLSERITLDEPDLKEIKDEERTLYHLIKEIINKYNEAVDEYHEYIESKNKS